MKQTIMNAPLPIPQLPPIDTRTTIMPTASGMLVGDVLYLEPGTSSFQITGEAAPGTYVVTDATKTHPPARNRHERRSGRR